MASLLNNASLLLNPAGSIISYQEDKIYSVIPKDGTGDFTFSGGDGGTRVNQQGYIEQTPANINTYSEKFGPGYWSNYGGTITDDTVVAPNGTVTGTTFNGSPAGTYKTYSGITVGQVYTVSAYVKLGTATNCVFIVNNSIAWNTVGGQSFTSANGLNTTDWTRISYTFTGPSNGQINWHIGQHFETAVTQQTNGTYFVWGAQLNIGSTAKPYQPTTDRLNYPRITYQNGRGALLSEPQRTNVNTYSQAIIAANGYNLGGCSLTGNNTISPDGTQNATLFVESANSNYHRYYKYGTGTASTKVWTIFAKYKPGGREWLTMDAGPTVWFNIANGTIGIASGDIIAQIEPYKDGWYRCTYIDPTSAVDLCYVGAGTYNGDPGNYAGDGRDCFWVWGMQCEDGVLFPTSYIPTTSATVTRPADSTNNTNTTNVASVVGQTEGVLYSDLYFEANGAERNYMYLNTNGSYNNGFLYLVGSTTNRLILDLYNFPYTAQFSAQSAVLTTGRYKAAIAYKQNDFAFYLNGVQIATDNSGTVPTLNRMYIGQGSDAGWTNGAPVFTTGFFPTRLTNAELATLTTVRSGSGGNISYYGPYTIHTFTGSATFTPSFTGPVEVLVVAAGGSGAAGWGNGGGMGGGGAGGLLYASSFGVSQGTGITVTIGAGGAGTTGTTQAGRNGTQRGNPGSSTSFGGLTAIGGGGGASDGATTATMTGGSGGGGGYASIGTGGAGTPGQGNNGGDHSNTNGYPSNYCGGGGGGAGVVGTPGTTAGGNGGNGLPYSVSGFSTYYAGGGGGGTYTTTGPGGAGVGGLGGGGNGGLGTTNPGQNGIAGVNSTGGAGGAGGCPASSPNIGGNGGAGGSGIVIVRYLT